MKRKQPVRAGFTLVELMVVVAIIAILVALTTAAVMKYLAKIPEITTRNEITQMSTALETFHARYKVYPPSALYLSNDPANYGKTSANAPFAFRQRSLQYIKSIWNRIDWGG